MVDKLKGRYQTLIILILLAIFLLPALWSLFHPGFFISDDGEWMIIRLTDFHRSLADGQIPVRWLSRLNHEYGYPVVNFLYPGFLYFGEITHLLGFNFVNSIKIVLGLSLFFSGIFSYLWLATIFRRFPSFVGALFYVYAPYHLYDVYTRGSVGEVLAFAFVPFCLWMIEKKNLPLLGFGYGLLIISHNTLALLFTPILIIDLFLTYRPFSYPLPSTLYPLLLGLGLSAFFWIPAIFDLKYTIFKETLVVDWQNVFFTGESQRPLDWLSILIFLLSLLFLKKMDKKVFLLWLIFPVSLFLALPISKFLWQILSLNQIVQFSFRFLFWAVLSGSFLAAFSLNELPVRLRITLGVFLMGLLFTFSFPFTQPKGFFDKGEGFYTTNEGTTTVKGEYMPRWAKRFPTERPQQKMEIVKGEGEIKSQFFNSKEIVFRADLKDNSVVQVNTIYFPGWQARVNGRKADINYENEKGLIQLSLPKGEYQVLVKFNETPLRLLSDIISLVSLLVLSGFLAKNYLLKK